uniref:MIP22416p n=1 Tax=Drosophila melanogaster TaxID=7227 RepID=D6W4R0_DROME|nr:MIP22416p [Drosophila melanogaster]
MPAQVYFPRIMQIALRQQCNYGFFALKLSVSQSLMAT